MIQLQFVGYKVGEYKLLNGIALTAKKGEITAIIGQNGAGKSTLLKLLSGAIKPTEGTVTIDNKIIADYDVKYLAKRRAMLSQILPMHFEFTVFEMVMMGRYPHFKNRPTANDVKLVNEVLEELELEGLKDRAIQSLSGGEQQRVHFARIKVQLSENEVNNIMLLDEPINHLDLKYQYQILDLAKAFAKKGNVVIAVLHDFKLTYKYANHVLLLHRGAKIMEGTPELVIHPNFINRLYGISLMVSGKKGQVNINVEPAPISMKENLLDELKREIMKPELLKTKWDELLATNPKTRIRNAAKELGVTEVELLSLYAGNTCTRLDIDLEVIFTEFVIKLGKVTAITRNDDVVHERDGVYLNPSFTKGSPVALFVGADIDLRMFMRTWKSVFAVQEESRGKLRYSIQFFSNTGEAVHKIYLTEESNKVVYDELVKKHASDNQEFETALVEPKPTPKEMPDDMINAEAFQKAWVDLKDTHDFYMLLGRFKLSRTQALRLSPSGSEASDYPSNKYALKLDNSITRRMLNRASEINMPIMVFVGNKGNIQIHTGAVKNIVDYEEWLNVIDPEFNLHIREKALSETWLVRKPTVDGFVHSIEVFDEKGELLVSFFGKRKPGIPEDKTWRQVCVEFERAALTESVEA